MANRLAESLSPYLRQHADNPVDWREWGPAAFAEARERDVPILLSVGYAACHWCHVMAHESFEDCEVAAKLHADFVSIKVDREERPDIDAVYMNVTQALTGHGGWPMTVFLTPDASPLYAGTYFPREHFLQVLTAISDVWRDERQRAEASGRAIVEAVSNAAAVPAAALDDAALAAAVTQLRREFDDARGGFGGAPKFPPSMTLEHLLRHHARTGNDDALAMAHRTCEAMARGGMYDQLDGGFARYSVDASWVVPHFEKMLYDNAQLLRVYAHLWRATGLPLARRVAEQTAQFMLRRLRTDEGAFASALDADTDGVEGLTYAWTLAQLVEVLGATDGERAACLLEVTERGTFEHGSSTLQLPRDPAAVFTIDELGAHPDTWWAEVRSRLLVARDARPQPGRDDKVVTSWNGLTISALAEAAMILDEPDLLDAARETAEFVVERHVVDGRLRRTSLGGRVSDALGCADDYGNLAEALLVLHQATGQAEYLTQARKLLDTALSVFVQDGTVHDTGSDAEQLFTRPRSSGDNAEPSGASSLAHAALTAHALTGEPTYRDLAETCVAQLADVARQSPRFAGWALAAAEALAAGPLQVAVVAESTDGAEAMRDIVWQSTSPGLVRVVGAPDTDGVPLLADRPLVNARPSAYVCRGFVCDAPTNDSDDLRRALGC